jgi:hypothetical protein
MMDPWIRRVEDYIDQLQSLVDEVDAIFQQTQVDVTKPEPESVQESAARLQDRLGDLERKVAERDQLLRADDAPSSGLTLIEKLGNSNHHELAERAERVAQQIGLAHQQSMSLFVCQFHLANLTTDLVRILTGADQPATYGGSGTSRLTPQGGLFNESA